MAPNPQPGAKDATLGANMAPKCFQMAPRPANWEPGLPNLGQGGPKTLPIRANMTPWPPTWNVQHSPEIAPTPPSWSQDPPLKLNFGHLWANLAHLGPNLAPNWPNLVPTWLNLVPTWPKLDPTWAQLGPNLAPTWSQVGPNSQKKCARL